MNENDINDIKPTTVHRRKQRLAGAVALLLAGGAVGGVLAATSSASAADTTTASASAPAARESGPANRGSASVRAGEEALTGADLATAKAAALKAVPGATVVRVETDADGATYEAHMTKADGSDVTVKFDKSMKVTAIQDGKGPGGPGGHRGPDGPGGHDDGPAPASDGATL